MNLQMPVLITSITLLTGILAHADPPTTERWAMTRILKRAIEHAPELKAAESEIAKANSLAKQAGKWDNPDVELSGGPMTQAGETRRMVDISVRQSVPIFGKKAIAKKIGEENQKSNLLELAKRRLAVKYEVTRLAIRFAALDEQEKHISHRQQKIRTIAKYLDTRPFASPSQSVEKVLIMNRLREIEERSLDITTAKQNAWRALNMYLELDAPILPETEWSSSPAIPIREFLIDGFEQSNPDLEFQKSQLASANLEVEQADKLKLPDIRVGALYNEQTVGSVQHTYAGIIEFSVPIVDNGNLRKLAATSEKHVQTYRLEQRRRELLRDFDQSWATLLQNKKRIELFPLSLVSSLESQMERAESDWRKGLVPVVTYLELENQVHDQIFKVFDAQSSFVEALTQLQFLAGVQPKSGEPLNVN